MSIAEIEETIVAFVEAAKRCQKSGFDGVEVWAAYHSLLDQFWTPFSNSRDDDWGGALENRTRLSREILRRIRKACGPDFITGLSVSDEPGVEAALGREDMAEIIALHDQEHLMDYVTVGSGSYFDFYTLIPSFQYAENLGVDLATRLKSAVQHAVVTAESHIRTPENANTVLGAGGADLVSIVRGQIADPHLMTKALTGRVDDIRGCLSCNQQCWGRRGRDYYTSCLINPSVGHEHLWGGDRLATAKVAKKILVVGAGPAGLEAARVAAERGHKVILAEASSDLGGQFRLAGLQPRRAQILDLMAWFERQLTQLGVEIRYNAYLDADEIAVIGADEVILATGSLPPETGFQKALPHVPVLPGLNAQVWSAADVMGRAARLGKQVIVLDEGGHWKGCGTAWLLAEEGHEVTLVTPDPMVGKELLRSATDAPLRKRLAQLNVRFVTESAITNWTMDGAGVVSLLTGKSEKIAAQSLVLATVNHADTALWNDLSRLGISAKLLGDAHAPRNAAYAIYDVRVAGLAI